MRQALRLSVVETSRPDQDRRRSAERVRILIVDDVPAFREAARALLEKRGHVVAESADGRGALETAVSFAPELPLVAPRPGAEPGFAASRALTRAFPDLPVVLMSVDSAEPLPEDVSACGARAYVPKRRLSAADLEGIAR